MNAAVGKSIPALATLILLLVIALAGIFAPVIAPHDPFRGNLRERNVPPAWMEGGSSGHLLGTDHLGRDVFSRLVYGARTSLAVSLAPVLAAAIVGAVLGIIAGYFDDGTGALDFRLADFPLVLFAILPVLLAQFTVPLALALVMAGGQSFQLLIVITAVLPGIIFAHQVWRETLRLKEGDVYGRALEAGGSASRIIIHHILPRVANSLIILAPLLVVYAIVLEGALSFLGAGVPPPTASWGSMVAEGRDRVAVAWWISTIAGLAILLTAFLLTLLANQLRGQFGPRPGAE